MEPGRVYWIQVDLGHTAFQLASGHALRLEIAGSYFPVYDRNSHTNEGPFAASARTSIEAAIKDFQSQTDGVQVESQVTGLRLVDIEFDSKTLRVIAEADGLVRALVTKIAVQ